MQGLLVLPPQQADPRPVVRRPRDRTVAFAVWLLLVLALAVATVLPTSHDPSQPGDRHVPATGGTVVIAHGG